MKILYMTPSTYNSGGTEHILSMKVNYLVRKAAYEVVIVTTDQKNRENFFEFDESVRHYDIGVNYEDDFQKNLIAKAVSHYYKNHVYKKRLMAIVQKERPDICVSLFGKEIDFLYKMKLPCKTVAELHFNKMFRYDFLMSHHQGWIWKQIGLHEVKRMVKETKSLDRLVVLTKEDLEQWKKTNDNVFQIYNPLPYEGNKVAELGNKSLISVGRLCQQKNYSSLIRAWRSVYQRHPDWHMNIWGDGEMHDQLQQEIVQYGLENVFHLCGRTENIKEKYLESSAYVMSSRYEGFPMVLLEAASFGLPMISYSCYCGPKDIIKDGENGFLVKQDDEQGLADTICRVIEDTVLRRTLGHQAKQFSRCFLQENILSLWPNFFRELC